MNNEKLRVWWISNMPNKTFRRRVESVDEAIKVIDLLANYDLYLGRLISTNAHGLEVWQDYEWVEYYDKEGKDIDQIMDEE